MLEQIIGEEQLNHTWTHSENRFGKTDKLFDYYYMIDVQISELYELNENVTLRENLQKQ